MILGTLGHRLLLRPLRIDLYVSLEMLLLVLAHTTHEFIRGKNIFGEMKGFAGRDTGSISCRIQDLCGRHERTEHQESEDRDNEACSKLVHRGI